MSLAIYIGDSISRYYIIRYLLKITDDYYICKYLNM